MALDIFYDMNYIGVKTSGEDGVTAAPMANGRAPASSAA
jgi:hypothetical protein